MFLSQEEKALETKKYKRMIVEPCEVCNGTGYITRNKNGYDTSFLCNCLKTVKRNVTLLDWGIPRKFLDDKKWNLQLLQDKSYYESIKSYIENFDDNFQQGRGLFLTGAHGRGKTTTECVIAKSVAMKINPDTFEQHLNYTVGFAMYDDIIKKMLSKNYAEVEMLKTFLYKSNLLIIDNVGNEMGKNEKQFSQRTLEMILRKRDNDCLSTIVSSNYNINEMETEYNIDVKGFLEQNNDIVFVAGDNFRKAQKTDGIGEW